MDYQNIRRKVGMAAIVALATITIGGHVSFAAPGDENEKGVLVASESADQNTQTMVTTDFLNVRTEPTTKARILGVLNIGAKVEGTPVGNWFKTKYLGHTVFVHGDYLRSAKEDSAQLKEEPAQEKAVETETRYTTDSLNVRTGPSTGNKILGVLRPGTKVEGVQEGNWFKTRYSGQTAYVHADYLRAGNASTTAEAGEWMTFKATAYDPSVGDTTRMGTPARLGVVAVDPRVIPLGSTVEVEGYGTFSAEDTGGAIKGNKIDIFVSTYREAMQFGIQTVRVRVLK